MAKRPVRNNNPGDLEAGTAWQGLMPPEKMTPEQAAEPRFAVFESPKWGFRAIAIILRNYVRKDKLQPTVRALITRWAPPSENDTKAYIKAVCAAIRKDADAALDLTDANTLIGLCRAIAVQEAGGWFFKPADLAAGVSLALRTS